MGAMDLQVTCGRSCRMTGTNSLTYAEGQIRSAGDLSLTAATVENLGGTLLSLGQVEITADSLRSAALREALVISRRSGLYNFWSGRTSWVVVRERLGDILGLAADVILTTLRPVLLEGGVVQASGSVQAPAGQETRAPSEARLEGGRASSGVFSRLPLIDR